MVETESQLGELAGELQRVLSKLFSVLRRGDTNRAEAGDLTLAQLSILLTLRASTHSFATAGIAVGGFAVAQATMSPLGGGLILSGLSFRLVAATPKHTPRVHPMYVAHE